MKNLLFVFLGGGAGSVLRYWISVITLRLFGHTVFPFATLVVNVAGCFLFALLEAVPSVDGSAGYPL